MSQSEQLTRDAALTEPASPRNAWTTELRALLGLAWPLIVAQLAQNAIFTTDVIMLGWLGSEALAAGTLAAALLNTLLIGSIGVVAAVAPLVAQALGARDLRSVRRIVQQGFYVATALSVLLMPVLWQIRPIFLLAGQDPSVTASAEEFMHVAVFAFPLALGVVVLRSLLAAHGATRIILLITVAGVLFNILGNYLLIFGNWGLPRLELRGAALSTVLVNVVMLALMLAFVLRSRRFRRYHILSRLFDPDWPRFFTLVRVGLPSGLTLVFEVGLFTVAALLMGWLGTAEVAAHAVALQLTSMSFMVPLGLSQATTVRVGLAYGARDREGIARAGWTAFVLTVGFMSTTCVLFLSVPLALVGLFLDGSQEANRMALGLAASYLAVAGMFQLVDGTQVIAASALRGLNDTAMPMVFALFGYWAVGLPVAYVLGFVLGWRGTGIWLGLAAGLTAVAIVLTVRFALRERLGLVR